MWDVNPCDYQVPITSKSDIVNKGAIVGKLVEGGQGQCPGEEGEDGDVSEKHADFWGETTTYVVVQCWDFHSYSTQEYLY